MNLILLTRALENSGRGYMSDAQRKAMFARLRGGGSSSSSSSGWRTSKQTDRDRPQAPTDGGPEAMAASGGGPSSMVLHPLGDVLGEIGAGAAQMTAEATGANETAVSLLAEAVRLAYSPRSALGGRNAAKADAALGLIGDAADSKPLSKKLLGRLATKTDEELSTILADAQQRRDKETVRAVTDLLTGEAQRVTPSETRKLLDIPKGFTFDGMFGPWVRQGLDKPTITQAKKAITDWARDRKLYLQQKLQAKGGGTPATFANAGRGPMNEAQRRAMWAKRQNPGANAPAKAPPPAKPGTPVKVIDQILPPRNTLPVPPPGPRPPMPPSEALPVPPPGRITTPDETLRLRLIQDQLRRAIESGAFPRPYIPIPRVPIRTQPVPTPPGGPVHDTIGEFRGAEPLPPAWNVPLGSTDPQLDAIIRSVDDLLARRGGSR